MGELALNIQLPFSLTYQGRLNSHKKWNKSVTDGHNTWNISVGKDTRSEHPSPEDSCRKSMAISVKKYPPTQFPFNGFKALAIGQVKPGHACVMKL